MANLKNTSINSSGFIDIPSGTTSERPVSPQEGDARINTDSNTLEYYNGSEWKAFDNRVRTAVTGSSVQIEEFNGFEVLVFEDSGNIEVINGGEVEYCILAGGGGGGAGNGGAGGGAGGLVIGQTTVTPGTYTVTVGAGGLGNGSYSGTRTNPEKGEDSSVFGITAEGGGYGATQGSSNTNGGNGGSGGGAAGSGGSGNLTNTGGSGSQGSNGGRGWADSGDDGGGGGGGFQQTGLNGYINRGGVGGDGVIVKFGRTGRFVAGGGGGGNNDGGDDDEFGGRGGGGRGSSRNSNIDSTPGEPNTGGGGGGGGNNDGSNGGSGLIMIRYRKGL